MPKKSIRDAVHGYIDLGGEEVRLIDTKEFQRLRGIKQLGLAYLVYPSATHSRFDHSLGTRYISEQIIESCNKSSNKHGSIAREINGDEAMIINHAALLHDIGHFPLSHALESEVRLFEAHDAESRMNQYLRNGEIGDILSEIGMVDKVSEVLSAIKSEKPESLRGKSEVGPFMAQIIGNTICADLLDYARRDMMYTGIGENYDETRLFRYFEVSSRNDEFFVRLADRGKLRRDVMSEIINVLRIRYSLAEKVIFHHAKLSAVSMLAKAVQYAQIRDLSDLDLMSDFELLTFLRKHENPVTSSLGSMLCRRKLFKSVFRGSSEDAHNKDVKKSLVQEYHDNPEKRLEFERDLEDKCGMEEGTIAVFCPTSDMHLKEIGVNVLWRDQPEMLRKLSELNHDPPESDIEALEKRYRALWSFYVFLHPEQLHKATEIEKHVGKLTNLDNDLRVRDPLKWEEFDRLESYVDLYAKDQDLAYSKQENLRQKAIERTFAFRGKKGERSGLGSYEDARVLLMELDETEEGPENAQKEGKPRNRQRTLEE